MYADKITESMKNTIEKTERRREKQKAFNKKNGITPQPLMPKKDSDFIQNLNPYKKNTKSIRSIIHSSSLEKLQKTIKHTKRKMEKMAKELNFIEAAILRDELKELEKNLKERQKKSGH